MNAFHRLCCMLEQHQCCFKVIRDGQDECHSPLCADVGCQHFNLPVIMWLCELLLLSLPACCSLWVPLHHVTDIAHIAVLALVQTWDDRQCHAFKTPKMVTLNR